MKASISASHGPPAAEPSSWRPMDADRSPFALRGLRCSFLDVFAERPCGGNGLAVVHDADGVPDAQMLLFARETRLSETTFLQTPQDAGADYRNRIWMPTGEIPFGGHPSIGTAVAVARAQGLEEAQLVQETALGLHTVEVERRDGLAYASMVASPVQHGAEVDGRALAQAAGLDTGDLHPELPAAVATAGLTLVVAPLREAAALDRARLDHAALAPVLDAAGAAGVYLAAWSEAEPNAAAARCFGRDAEIGEDPATGAAAVALAAYLADRAGVRALAIRQGAQMGRPSRLETSVEPAGVRLGGPVVPLLDAAFAA